MSCILRVGGSDLNVDSLLLECALEADSLWKKGEPKFPHSSPDSDFNESSGARIRVSDADFSEFALQIEDANHFFENHRRNLEILNKFPGIEWAVVDFGVEIRPPGWSSFNFPPELLALIGQVGITLAISTYPVDDEPDHNA
jgi:hypothetical protein